MYGVDAEGESVGGMSGGVDAVDVELKVIGVGMKGNVRVVCNDLEHGEEINLKRRRLRIELWGITWVIERGVVECELILTVEERLEM